MLLSILDTVPWYYLHLKTRANILFRRRFANTVFEFRVFSRVLYVMF